MSDGANPNACCADDGNTALHETVKYDNIAIAFALVVAGADVNATADFGWTPLHLAASFNASKVIRLLIGAGADVTAKTEEGETPLDIAQNQGSPDVVQILEANDADDDGGAPKKTSKRGFLGIQIFAGCLLALFASLMCTISFRGRFAWPSDE